VNTAVIPYNLRKSYGLKIWDVHSQGPSEQEPIKKFWRREHGHSQRLPIILGTPIVSGRVKLRTSNFVHAYMGSIGTKAHGKSRHGHSQGVPKIFKAPIYCIGRITVIFAIAQFSCMLLKILTKIIKCFCCTAGAYHSQS